MTRATRATPRHRAEPASKAVLRRTPVLFAIAAVLCICGSAVAAVALTNDGRASHQADGPTAPTTGQPDSDFSESGILGESTELAPTSGSDSTTPDGSPSTGGSSSTTTTGSTGTTTGTVARAPQLTSPAQAAQAAPSAKSTAASSPASASVTANRSINISANIAAMPATDASCKASPTAAACTNAAVAALNHARAVLGLPAYAIPANFVTMTPSQQLLTLSNLDRALYGLATIKGLNATLNTAAQQGVTSGGDPVGVDVGTAKWTGWASNWASGYPSAAFTYYAWMYDDGVGSPNRDCTTATSPGCWGHRLNTLHNFGSGVQIAMGVGSSTVAFTELYESFASAAAIPYL